MDLHLTPEAGLLNTSSEDPITQQQSDAVTPDVTDTPSNTTKPLTTDRLQALLQM